MYRLHHWYRVCWSIYICIVYNVHVYVCMYVHVYMYVHVCKYYNYFNTIESIRNRLIKTFRNWVLSVRHSRTSGNRRINKVRSLISVVQYIVSMFYIICRVMRALTSSFGSENEVAVKILNGMWYCVICVIVHYRHGAKYFYFVLFSVLKYKVQATLANYNYKVQAYTRCNLSTSNGHRCLKWGCLIVMRGVVTFNWFFD